MGLFKHSLLAAGAVFALTGPAAAIPVTWQLQNAVFENGRTATGSFVFDADLNIYSNIDINTMPSPTNHYGIPDPPFLPLDSNLLIAVTGVLADYTGTPGLVLRWASPLSNAGGTVPFSLEGLSSEGTCVSVDCNIISSLPASFFVSGEVVAAPAAIPEPASLTLLAVGLFGVSLGRRQLRTSVVHKTAAFSGG